MNPRASTYEQRVRQWSSTSRWRMEAAALLDLMALAPGTDVLDVGTGAGSLEPVAAERGLTLFGVDRWDNWVGAGDGARAARGEAMALPFRSATFDAVVLHHVIAHVPHPTRALDEARRVMRPSGRIGIATPNAWFVKALMLPSLVNRHRMDPTVVRHLTLRSLVRLVEEAGFRIIHAVAWGSLPWICPLPALRERILVVAEASA